MKSDTTTNATSSPESAGGLSPCDGPDSKTQPESGPAPVPVSRFRALAKDRATPTSGTCGPLFTASSPSAVLQRSLESRLRARMDVNGSPEFALTWKTWDMPAGEPICALRASERRTGGKGCIGWPTPQANKNTKNSRDPKRMKENGSQTCLADAAHLCHWSTPTVQDSANNAGPSQFERNTHPLNVQATLAAWPTPQEDNANNSAGHKGTAFSDLPTTAQLASWPTPQAHDTQEQGQAREMTATGRIKTHTGSDVSANLPMVAGWATPRATDAKCGDTYTENCEGKDLAKDASLVAWATPRAEDAESAGMRHSRGVADTLSAQAGQDASRSNAATERPAGFRLNPRFSLWLMGYPVAWASCGERAMQSFQKQRRRL